MKRRTFVKESSIKAVSALFLTDLLSVTNTIAKMEPVSEFKACQKSGPCQPHYYNGHVTSVTECGVICDNIPGSGYCNPQTNQVSNCDIVTI